jgi:hypothetical protein
LKAISTNAILYTLRELGRRAGAAPDWIATWRVQFREGLVILYPQLGSQVTVVFPLDRSKPDRFLQLQDLHPSRWSWMRPPGAEMLEAIPDFIVLFDDCCGEGASLFSVADPDSVKRNTDILTSSLWTLSRSEETIPGPSDEHGRFPASSCTAFRFGCLDRPIIDEYGLAFRQALKHLLPGWTPEPSQFRVKLSHDIDLVGLPRRLRSTIGHLYPRRIPRAFLRDVFSTLGVGAPAYLDAVVKTARISQDGGFDSAFYWKASARTHWDSGYDLQHPHVCAVIEDLVQQGFEMGVHPAYHTFGSGEQLEEEVSRLRSALGFGLVGGRQHFLRWRPSSWLLWEKAGLAYDSSVGFADAMGFRAGTAVPYHPWLVDADRESTLLEIPLLVMDCTPIEYMRLDEKDTLSRIAVLVRRCEVVGGVFTMLWHNSSVIERPYASLYSRILSSLPSRARYDWKAGLATWPLPRIVRNGAVDQPSRF